MQAGAQLTPTLELVREVGRGAMGTVWEARNTALDRPVAVKVLRADSAFTMDGEARFAREIEVLAALDHPHLVRILDRGETAEGAPFFVMEFLRGEDLGARLAREGTLSVADTVAIVTQACRGLTVAHDRGVVHRDLKPANLFLLDDEGVPFVKVLDFGIAKRATELGMTSTGFSVGTPYFMSPEQFFTPSKADHRADLWALGVVAYTCLTGTMPFVGETPSAIGLAAIQQSLSPITELRPDLDERWDRFFARALDAEPSRRFQSARELADALRLAASGVDAADAREVRHASAAPTALELAPTAAVERLVVGDTELAETPALPEPAGLAATAPSREVAAVTSVSGRGLASAQGGAAHRARLVAFSGLAVAAGVAALVVARPWAHRSEVATDDRGRPSGSVAPSPTESTGDPAPVSSVAPPLASSAPTAASSATPDTSSVVVASASPSAWKPSPTAASLTAGPLAEPRPFPLRFVQNCWLGNEGADAKTQGGSARVEIDISAGGKAEAVRVRVLGDQFPAFRACVVTKLSQTHYGPGMRETLTSSVGLPRGFGKGPPPPQ